MAFIVERNGVGFGGMVHPAFDIDVLSLVQHFSPEDNLFVGVPMAAADRFQVGNLSILRFGQRAEVLAEISTNFSFG